MVGAVCQCISIIVRITTFEIPLLIELLDVPSLTEGIDDLPLLPIVPPLQAKPAHIKGNQRPCHPHILVATLSGTVEHATLGQKQYHGPELIIIIIMKVLLIVRSEGLVLSSVANLVHLCGEGVGSIHAWKISCR